MAAPTKIRRFRILALLCGVGLGLVAAEASLRLLTEPEGEVEALSRLAAQFAPPAPASDCRRPAAQARLREIVVPSPHPDVIYELRRDVDTCFEGARVRIDSLGVRRSTELQVPKPADTYRILALGDSHGFGWALPEADTVAAQLETALDELTPLAVEVVNAGVPGYSAYQEAAWLEARGRDFEPDCVVVLFVANDMGLPHFLLRPPKSGPSLLFDRLRAATASRRWFTFSPNELATFVGEVDMDRIPVRYRHMVGEKGYREALRKLSDEAATQGFDLVNLFDYSTLAVDSGSLIEFQRGLGITPLEMPWPRDPAFRVSETDPHLNRAGIAVVTEFLLRSLREESVCLPPGVGQAP